MNDPQIVLRAFQIASDLSTSAVDGCQCKLCEEERTEMREWFLNEAREQMEREAHE